MSTDKIKYFLEKERENYSLWYSVLYLFGILYYFSLQDEPSIIIVTIFVTTLVIAKIYTDFYTKTIITKFFLNITLAFFLGIFASSVKAHIISPVAIKEKMNEVNVEGIVTKIRPMPYGLQVNIDNVRISELSIEQTPKAVRINFSKFKADHLMVGDSVSLKADLSPPPSQIVPGGYDFKLVAYFNQIGAVGKSMSEAEVISYAQNTFLVKLLNLRKHLQHLLIEKLGIKNGNFAAAMFLGETGGIDQTTLTNMRFSGISHILCVSGLHLSLVAAIFFMSSRFLLNFSNYIAFRYDIKKISAYISLVASFFYLLLTGIQIAATRAFIMTSIVIWSLLISRQPHPMRSLSIACILILTLNPEYAIHPSFQLSFIAVSSLLAAYEFYIKNKNIFGSSKGIVASLRLYTISNIYSSVVASLATAPIVIYHFYTYSNYSILANLIALPVVSFITMPIGILAILFSFCSFSNYLFVIVGESIDIIREVSNFIVKLPKAIIYTSHISNYSIMIFLISFFWLLIWKSKIRLLGFAGICLSIILYMTEKLPNILINQDAKFIALHQNNKLTIYGEKISPFTRKFVANWYGLEKAEFKKIDLNYKKLFLEKANIIVDFRNHNIEIQGNTVNIPNLITISLDKDKYNFEIYEDKRFLFK